ncbi:hypothetical protein [Providencia sp. PROV212]|uniref:hypothetical protein n=1 Tax=Providencia sp. PROV212 TaxID=2949909 RepID=UPI002349915F|nr:hypothetical protein [Providencia sp. PROV212]
MKPNTVSSFSKPQLSANNIKETDQTENKASNHFKTSLKKVTQSFVSFFSLFLVPKANKPARNKSF